MRSTPKAKEALALLRILALGNRDVAAGRIKPVADVVARLRAKSCGDPARATTPEEKRQALEAALRDGIESGGPRPFDFDAFKARMRAKRGGTS